MKPERLYNVLLGAVLTCVGYDFPSQLLSLFAG